MGCASERSDERTVSPKLIVATVVKDAFSRARTTLRFTLLSLYMVMKQQRKDDVTECGQ